MVRAIVNGSGKSERFERRQRPTGVVVDARTPSAWFFFFVFFFDNRFILNVVGYENRNRSENPVTSATRTRERGQRFRGVHSRRRVPPRASTECTPPRHRVVLAEENALALSSVVVLVEVLDLDVFNSLYADVVSPVIRTHRIRLNVGARYCAFRVLTECPTSTTNSATAKVSRI